MKATVGQFKTGYRIQLSGLTATDVNRLRRVLEHAGRGQVWDGASTRGVAMIAAQKISKALGVQDGEFFAVGDGTNFMSTEKAVIQPGEPAPQGKTAYFDGSNWTWKVVDNNPWTPGLVPQAVIQSNEEDALMTAAAIAKEKAAFAAIFKVNSID